MLAPPKPELARFMAENPGTVFEEAAKQHGVTPREVVEALPASMRRLAPAAGFIQVMGDHAKWGDVRLIVHRQPCSLSIEDRSHRRGRAAVV
jgi:putative heme iron utilization protein